jgi:hypothetical protein
VATCASCGRQPEPADPDVPLGWMVDLDERGRRTVVCPDCTRRHARAIEGKLDQAWW